MPSTDALQPPLTAAEREITKSYGGWSHFMISYGLKPYNSDDIEEAHAIIKELAKKGLSGRK